MIALSSVSLDEHAAGALPLSLLCYEDAGITGAKHLSSAARKELVDLAKSEGFKGGVGEVVAVSWSGRRWLLAGLGKKKGPLPAAERARRAAGALAKYAKDRFAEIAVAAGEHPQPVAEGLLLASYKFQEYRKPEADTFARARLLAAAAEKRTVEAALARATLAAEAVCLVRDLVNRAPSDKSPQALADFAKTLAGGEIKAFVIGAEKAKELGMGALLGVSRGSAQPPALVHLVYSPKAGAKKKVALVGKGITFDSGGLSLKPPQAMETMKMDMAGAATVLALFKVLPRLKIRAEVHGLAALAYNMPGHDAMKPGDVVRAMNGKTIEVLNTDAEGRLVLADALCYAAKQEPQAIIDLATLTGAVVTALGSKVTGVMTNSRPLWGQLSAAAERADEALCELPLPEDYKECIKSSVADILNIGKPRGEAGPIIGGLFLQEFVGDIPWAHLDIAGTAWADGAHALGPAGGTGALARTLIEYLSAL